MSEQQTSFWRRPWKGARGSFLWFVFLAAAAFVIVFCFGLITGSLSPLRESLPVISVIALGVALVVVFGFLFVRWLCCWRNFRRFLFTLACGVTLIAILYAQENFRGKRAWDKHRRPLEASGEKFTIRELVPPSVPDEKNFALTPLLRPALDLTRVNGQAVWRDTNGLHRLQKVSAQLTDNRKSDPAKLVLGSVEKNTFADLEACRQFYRGNTNYPQPATPGTAAQDVLVALSKFDPEMKELREAAVARPYSRFSIDYDYQPPWLILLPHLARIKDLCQLTHVRAVAQLDLGHSAEAFEELKLGFRLSDAIREEPLLIDHLVRVATVAVNLQTVREGLARHSWNDAQLAEIESYLSSMGVLAECKLAIRGERACTTSGLDYMRRFGVGPDFVGDGEESGVRSVGGGGRKFFNLPSGWYYQNMLRISRKEQDFMIAAIDEKAHRVSTEVTEGFPGALTKMRTGPYTVFVKLLAPALGGAIRKSSRMQTLVNQAQLACAIERYRLANGKLPDGLDALTPRFIEKIPNDVIDGQPLRYHVKADGSYALYSIGWNKTDDGGQVVWTSGKTPSVDLTKGDWAWQMPAKLN